MKEQSIILLIFPISFSVYILIVRDMVNKSLAGRCNRGIKLKIFSALSLCPTSNGRQLRPKQFENMKGSLMISCALALCSIAFTGMSQHADKISIRQNDLILQADSLMANYKFEKALELLSQGDSLNTDILLRIGQCNT